MSIRFRHLSLILALGLSSSAEASEFYGFGHNRLDQADLDLALLSWGDHVASVPDAWTTSLPSGIVDQGELNGVLLNWGRMHPLASAAAVPEPTAAVLLLIRLVAVSRRSSVNSRPASRTMYRRS